MPHDSPEFPELMLNVHRRGGGRDLAANSVETKDRPTITSLSC